MLKIYHTTTYSFLFRIIPNQTLPPTDLKEPKDVCHHNGDSAEGCPNDPCHRQDLPTAGALLLRWGALRINLKYCWILEKPDVSALGLSEINGLFLLLPRCQRIFIKSSGCTRQGVLFCSFTPNTRIIRTLGYPELIMRHRDCYESAGAFVQIVLCIRRAKSNLIEQASFHEFQSTAVSVLSLCLGEISLLRRWQEEYGQKSDKTAESCHSDPRKTKLYF